MKNEIDGSLVLLGDEHSGRDEMNLAGNPFALLNSGARAGQSLIKNEWERLLPNGRVVTAIWEVNGHTELGLPGPNEELLYLVLLEITRESADANGVWPQTVMFSRYNVMQRMGWEPTARRYKELKECFVRLNAVSINTEHAFWNAKAKMPYAAVGFGLIADYGLDNESKGRKVSDSTPNSWFTWDKVIYGSFQDGNVRSLALDFALSLELPTSRRLFRFLDMMRGSTTPPRREFAIGLFKLAERLGMTKYKYASKIKEKLLPAIEELKERHYLDDVRFQKSKDDTELALFAFASIGQSRIELTKESGVKGEPKQLSMLDSAAATSPTAFEPDNSFTGNEEVTGVRLDAIRCHAIFKTLDEAEQAELLNTAKKDVSPIWHDRVGQPESPMSLGLWQLVAKRYPERLK
jgi:hypothetical protein